MRTLSNPRRFIPVALALIVVVASAPALADGPGDRLVIFGDSLSDPGNYFAETGDSVRAPYEPVPSAPYTIGGFHFSNGNTWIEQLAIGLRVPSSAGPAVRAPGVYTNYAFGRARARAGANFPEFDLGYQVNRFLVDFEGRAPRGATYVVWFGGNDVRDALSSLADDPTGATAAVIVQTAVEAIADNIAALYLAGAREFLVPNIPNLGQLPSVRALGAQNPLIPIFAEQLSVAFNDGLEGVLVALEASFPELEATRLDTFTLINEIVADPEAAGFENATDPCLSFGVVQGAICPLPGGHLFWDGAHPTVAGHARVADAAEDALSTP